MTTVWTVEDNTLYRATLTELINRQPAMSCECQLVDCEALFRAMATRAMPDVILLDLGLPEMPGIRAIPYVRTRSERTRIVVLTVHDDDDLVFDSLRAGADGYLLKSASGPEIIDAIDTAMRGGAPINAFIARKILTATLHVHAPAPQQIPASESSAELLTPREREILQELVNGCSLKQVAAVLGISRHTVDTHVRKIYAKLEVTSRSGAVGSALRRGLITP